MKKLFKPIVKMLDALHRFRVRRMFVTSGEARRMVERERKLDTQAGRAWMDNVRESLAELNRIKLQRSHNLLEVRFLLNLKSLEAVGLDQATELVSQLAAQRLRAWLVGRVGGAKLHTEGTSSARDKARTDHSRAAHGEGYSPTDNVAGTPETPRGGSGQKPNS